MSESTPNPGQTPASAEEQKIDLRSGTGAQPLTDLPETEAATAWAMVEASPDALVMVDERGIIELVNRQTEALFGYDRGELLGRPVEMLLPDQLAELHRAHRSRYQAAPDVRSMGSGLELRGRRLNGSEFPVEVSLSPMPNADELRIIAAVRDISDRVAADAATRRIHSGVDSVLDGVYMFDPETWHFVYVNQGGAKQTGYRVDELLAEMTPLDLTPAFTRTEFTSLLAPLIDGSEISLKFETIMRARTGEEFPVDVVLEYPTTGADENRVFVAVVRDISERIEAEQRVEIIQHSIDSVSDAVFVCDESTLAFLHVNQGAVDLHGYSREELLSGMNPAMLAPDMPRDDVDAALEHLATSPQSEARIATTGVTKAGARVPVEVLINWPLPARPGAPRPVMAVVRDISERSAIEAHRRRQHELSESVSQVRLAMLQGASRAEGLTIVCETAKRTLDAAAVVILTPTGDNDDLAIEVAIDLPDELRNGLSFKRSAGIVGEVLRTGNAQLTTAESRREGVVPNRTVLDEQMVGSVVVAPLHGSGELTGVFIVGSGPRSARQLDHDDVVDIERFASEAVVAIELAAVRESHRRLELLEDRERIGRDMHDKVIGRLFATGMGIQAVTARITDPEANDRLNEMVDEIDTTIKEIRSTIYGTRSHIDWDKGLRGQILALTADHTPTLGFEPAVHLSGAIDDLPAAVADELLATLREGLTNAGKYAQARSVNVVVKVDYGELCLRIADDGIGFSRDERPHDQSASTGNGLRNITARAEALGGASTITSSPGQGSTIDWTVPLS